ncbi:hypothetical protein ACFLUB_02310 [Chloroflexota bacterium]
MGMKRYQILLVASIAVMLVFTSCGYGLAGGNSSDPYKAAIIDQLHVLEPNPEVIAKMTEKLESYGFEVDVWRGEEVTVDFYKELPKHGYKLIIFRVHSGILLSVEGEKLVPSETTYLFTGETYNKTRYVSDQLTDKVSNALMSDKYPLVFAVNSEFIADDFEGTFDDTVILSMGCESQYLDDMAAAFIQKGASMYLGWSTVVSLDYVDNAVINLLNKLCTDNMTVEQGIATTMAEVGTDPYFKAYLKHYPDVDGSQTIKELIK